jgi:hypothetical protein
MRRCDLSWPAWAALLPLAPISTKPTRPVLVRTTIPTTGRGLTCHNGTVNRIYLENLQGVIDGPALGALTGLTFLELQGVMVTGLPTQIGRLSALTYLAITYSLLNGTVPSEIGTMSSLNTLTLNNNKLTGTLPALDKLTQLTALITAENRGLGGSIPALPLKMRDFKVQNCAFTALPPNLSALTGLQFLVAIRNKLVGAPPVVPPLLALCSLQASDAKAKPTALTALPTLPIFSVDASAFRKQT